MCTERDSKKHHTSKSTNLVSSSMSTSSKTVEEGAGAELSIADSFLKPLYLLGVWEEPRTKNRRINTAIKLTSGGDQHDFSICVHESGLTLELTVKSPDPLVDLSLLHTKRLQSKGTHREVEFTMFHRSVLVLENALKEKRERASDGVFYTTRIPLPFAVQTHIEGKSNLLFKESGAKIVYIQLKAMVESYAVTADNTEFEEF